MHEYYTSRYPHALIAEKLEQAGFDVGLMLWTAVAHNYTPDEIKERWQTAFNRAGIAKLEFGEDRNKERVWFKVWRKEGEL